jgi:hypothetical protein
MARHVDVFKVTELFLQWAKQAVPLEAGQVLSFDGKALASTIQDAHGSDQDFVTVVSACLQQWDCVVGQLSFHHGESSEITTVRELLRQLNVQGMWVTLDALHTQKNGG